MLKIKLDPNVVVNNLELSNDRTVILIITCFQTCRQAPQKNPLVCFILNLINTEGYLQVILQVFFNLPH